jgi:two-component sensor histidine kinase
MEKKLDQILEYLKRHDQKLEELSGKVDTNTELIKNNSELIKNNSALVKSNRESIESLARITSERFDRVDEKMTQWDRRIDNLSGLKSFC